MNEKQLKFFGTSWDTTRELITCASYSSRISINLYVRAEKEEFSFFVSLDGSEIIPNQQDGKQKNDDRSIIESGVCDLYMERSKLQSIL